MCCLAACLWLPPAQGSEVFIAAASDLVYCLDELNTAFKKTAPGIRLRSTTGSSGNFTAQIRHGAPFDVLLSADAFYPKALIESGDAVATSWTPYAVGRLALWTARTDLDLQQGLSVLAQPEVRTFAIASPDHAPYGRAAQAALTQAGLWQSLSNKRVMGDNIVQALQFAQTGHADVGVLALSLVLSPAIRDQGQFYLLPDGSYPPLNQVAVVTRKGRQNAGAHRYVKWLVSPQAQAIFSRHGFLSPGHVPAPPASPKPLP